MKTPLISQGIAFAASLFFAFSFPAEAALTFKNMSVNCVTKCPCSIYYGAACQPNAFQAYSIFWICAALIVTMYVYGLARREGSLLFSRHERIAVAMLYGVAFLGLHLTGSHLAIGLLVISAATASVYLVTRYFKKLSKINWFHVCIGAYLISVAVTGFPKPHRIIDSALAMAVYFFSPLVLPALSYRFARGLAAKWSFVVKASSILIMSLLLIVPLGLNYAAFNNHAQGLPKLAEKGNPLAQYYLGKNYAEGNWGYPKDKIEAYFWLLLAEPYHYEREECIAVREKIGASLTDAERNSVGAKASAWEASHRK